MWPQKREGEPGREVSSREARSLGPDSEGIMELGCQASCGGGRGEREQEKGPGALQALGLVGCPQMPKCESVPGHEGRPRAGPLILNSPFPLASETTDALSADYLPGALLSSVFASSYFILTISP